MRSDILVYFFISFFAIIILEGNVLVLAAVVQQLQFEWNWPNAGVSMVVKDGRMLRYGERSFLLMYISTDLAQF